MAFVIGNPVLTIERIPNSINRKVRVQYVIAFDQQDIAGNRPYESSCDCSARMSRARTTSSPAAPSRTREFSPTVRAPLPGTGTRKEAGARWTKTRAR